jgi:VIT1/CCC1 family predicted Fe2+/Mn2+ transporter
MAYAIGVSQTGILRKSIFLISVQIAKDPFSKLRSARAAMAAATGEARLDRSLGLCLLSFLSTFPIVIPFIVIGEARLALRVSNAVAIVMLCFCGYVFGYRSGLRPWVTALAMVAIGGALVGVAIALGG